MTAYDAAYVALAEALHVVLVTADARLARASDIRCGVEVISGGDEQQMAGAAARLARPLDT